MERVWGDWEAALFSELEVGEGRGCKESSSTSHQPAGFCRSHWVVRRTETIRVKGSAPRLAHGKPPIIDVSGIVNVYIF